MTDKPTVDRDFAEKFLQAIDDPMNYHVYLLFHDWWEKAPASAIDAYLSELATLDGARECIDEGYISEPLSLERLAECAPGTLGHGYAEFIVSNKLEANLGKNYRTFNEELHASGKLNRLPADMSYMMVRGFQIHDFLHVLTGYSSAPLGELSLAAFYLAQLRFPYHAMRLAVTLGHTAYIKPELTVPVMDAVVDGWAYGRAAQNLNFARWEEEIDTPLTVLQDRFGLHQQRQAA